MPQLPKHTAKSKREDAYWNRLCATHTDPLALPVAVAPSSMPSKARWRKALDQATRLLYAVREEMEDYSQERSDRWQEGGPAEVFRESMEQLDKLHTQLDDLRSEF